VLQRHGLVVALQHRAPKAGKRFERKAPKGLWQIDGTMVALTGGSKAWIVDALKNAATTTLIEPDAVFPTDSGSVYTSTDFRASVAGLGMGRSCVGRNGVCWDNSMAEPSFSMLKNEHFKRTVYATKPHAHNNIIRYIEGFYNSRRRHSAPVTDAPKKSTIVIGSQPSQHRRIHQFRCHKTPHQPSCI